MSSDTELEALARAIIDSNVYMTLGTANADGEPWVSPVFYVADGYSDFYWISSLQATQVRNIAVRPRVGIVVFDSRQEPGTGEGVYMSATAGQLTGADLDRGIEIYLGAGVGSKTPDHLRPPGPYGVYRARVTEHSVLCPLGSREPCPVHGRPSDHRTVVIL
jgi:hypothetical protein